MKIIIFVLISICGSSTSLFVPQKHPEASLNIVEAIEYYGYPCEDHEVVTEDGYILKMQRIPHGKVDEQTNGTRHVVLLQHGLLDSAHTWIINTPRQSLGFILADMGFDVWLGNSRGTTYSKGHMHFSPKSKEFWEFSFDDMAEFDLPAFIHYALKISKAATLHYIGHSQGSLIGFAKFSKDKELASLVSSFIALGPVTTVKHLGWIPHYTLKTLSLFAPIINLISKGEFLPNSGLIQLVAEHICSKDILTPVCYNPIFWLAGFDLHNLNTSRLPVIIGTTPAGTSIRNLQHFNQLAKSGAFQMYDYGSKKGNLYQYGTASPPLYDVSQLDIPLSMYWGGKDILASPEDVKGLIPLVYKTLKHHKFIHYYNHMDYIWGVDANRVIYKEAIDFMKSYAK